MSSSSSSPNHQHTIAYGTNETTALLSSSFSSFSQPRTSPSTVETAAVAPTASTSYGAAHSRNIDGNRTSIVSSQQDHEAIDIEAGTIILSDQEKAQNPNYHYQRQRQETDENLNTNNDTEEEGEERADNEEHYHSNDDNSNGDAVETERDDRQDDEEEALLLSTSTIRGEGDNSDDGSGEGEGNGEGPIGNLTQRLRCLFSTITWPIVPLGTIVSLAFLWVLYAASSLDLHKSCSHPLHSYAVVSLVLVAYIPNHSYVRSHLFQYSRERDGPLRPTRVRIYDQFFHTVCLLYVYTGVTLIQTCRDDIVDNSDSTIVPDNVGGPPLNTCDVTCPNLYQALSVYIATLELFTFALILPLLFLPCIYLWFLQRATEEADAFSQLQDRLQEEETLVRNGGVTTGQILDNLERVKIVAVPLVPTTTNISNSNSNPSTSSLSQENDHESSLSSSSTTTTATTIIDTTDLEQQQQQQIWVVPYNTSDSSATTVGVMSDVKECCICMSEFIIKTEDSLCNHESNNKNNNDKTDNMIETSSDRDGVVNNNNDSCNVGDCMDNDDYSGDISTCVKKEPTIVRTKCGHVFHHECLRSWVGGKWTLNTNNSNENNNNQDCWRQRKARKIYCPLCREDLRPSNDTI